MSNKHIIILALAFILLIPLIFAQDMASLGYFKHNENVRVKQICDNCTYVNVTEISYPNSSVAVSNKEMTQSSSIYYYDFNLTSLYGRYIVTTCGNPDGTYTCESYDFWITPNGEEPNSASAILYIGLLLLIVLGFLIITYFGVTSGNIIAKTFSIGFGYLFLIAIFFLAWQMAQDFLTSSPFLIDFFYYIFLAFMIGFFPLLIILFVYGVYMMLTIKEIKSLMERGVPEGEAVERVRWKK